jgi:hypothetical protein
MTMTTQTKSLYDRLGGGDASMRETHDGMKVTAGEFEVVMQHLGTPFPGSYQAAPPLR